MSFLVFAQSTKLLVVQPRFDPLAIEAADLEVESASIQNEIKALALSPDGSAWDRIQAITGVIGPQARQLGLANTDEEVQAIIARLVKTSNPVAVWVVYRILVEWMKTRPEAFSPTEQKAALGIVLHSDPYPIERIWLFKKAFEVGSDRHVGLGLPAHQAIAFALEKYLDPDAFEKLTRETASAAAKAAKDFPAEVGESHENHEGAVLQATIFSQWQQVRRQLEGRRIKDLERSMLRGPTAHAGLHVVASDFATKRLGLNGPAVDKYLESVFQAKDPYWAYFHLREVFEFATSKEFGLGLNTNHAASFARDVVRGGHGAEFAKRYIPAYFVRFEQAAVRKDLFRAIQKADEAAGLGTDFTTDYLRRFGLPSYWEGFPRERDEHAPLSETAPVQALVLPPAHSDEPVVADSGGWFGGVAGLTALALAHKVIVRRAKTRNCENVLPRLAPYRPVERVNEVEDLESIIGDVSAIFSRPIGEHP